MCVYTTCWHLTWGVITLVICWYRCSFSVCRDRVELTCSITSYSIISSGSENPSFLFRHHSLLYWSCVVLFKQTTHFWTHLFIVRTSPGLTAFQVGNKGECVCKCQRDELPLVVCRKQECLQCNSGTSACVFILLLSETDRVVVDVSSEVSDCGLYLLEPLVLVTIIWYFSYSIRFLMQSNNNSWIQMRPWNILIMGCQLKVWTIVNHHCESYYSQSMSFKAYYLGHFLYHIATSGEFVCRYQAVTNTDWSDCTASVFVEPFLTSMTFQQTVQDCWMLSWLKIFSNGHLSHFKSTWRCSVWWIETRMNTAPPWSSENCNTRV